VIDIEIEDGIAVVTLKHGKANALDIELCEALAARFMELRKSNAKAVVITGQGKIFSAGVNLIKLSEGGADYIRKFLPALHGLYDAVFYQPKPVVAAINGHAIAGGCVLACCADRRVMANDGGRIGVTELLVGVPFPALAFEIMRHTTSPYFFSETMLSGATFSADAAARRGWVNEAVEPAVLMERALAVAQSLAALSPPAFAQTKKQIRANVATRFEHSGEATDKTATEIWTAPETLTYIRDYVARTLKKKN
jgi:enoyl-CoA hydratase